MTFFATASFVFTLVIASPSFAKDCVVLLHGLSRTSNSMVKLEDRLHNSGFVVHNIAYPSRNATIEELSEDAVTNGRNACEGAETTSFVTHSMGGILVRDYFARHAEAKRPNKVVMLAPPNQGSQIIDISHYQTLGAWWNGPAAWQLSAKPDSYVNQLPPVDFLTGVIAGSSSIEPYTANILPGEDDGKVSVASTRADGVADWILIKATHTFIMRNDVAIDQVIYFLKHDRFSY